MYNYYIKLYSEDPEKHRPLIEDFRQKTFEEGSTSLTHKKYDCDDPNIETWMFFVEGKLASISAAERSHYTNDPDIAVRVCRYHILKPYRFSHAGLIMGEKQVQWARQKGFEILYITHDITNKAINRLYQRKRKMTVPTSLWKKSSCSVRESCFNMCTASDCKMKILHGDQNQNTLCISHTTDRYTNSDYTIESPMSFPTKPTICFTVCGKIVCL